jgi:tRNA nucleotidyltransferase (CCA-adding enzyme)
VVRAAVRVAREQQVALYLVGGTVRDILLGKQPKDLDLMIEALPRRFARKMAAQLNAEWHFEPRFLTASLLVEDHVIDLARARRETYAHAGALPRVFPATAAQDLMRRDFSVNAMAVALAGPGRGVLLDSCGGERDLRARTLRVLHDRSFIDDPTRILRGIRLASRLGFSFEARTRRLAAAAVKSRAFESVSADRIRQEIFLLLQEPEPANALALGKGLGLTRALLPGLRVGKRLSDALERARGYGRILTPDERRDAMLLSVLAFSAHPLEGARRLGLSGSTLRAAKAMVRFRGSLAGRLREAGPSVVVRILDALPPQVILALACATTSQQARRQMLQYLRHWRFAKPKITGDDLLRLGFAEGPALGAALRAARDAQLDGTARTRTQQMRIASARLRRDAGSSAPLRRPR